MSRTTICLCAASVFAATMCHSAAQDKPTAAAADARAFAVDWRQTVKFEGVPRLAVGSDAVFVGASGSGLSAYAASDGRARWGSAANTDLPPVVVANVVACLSANVLEVLDQPTGRSLWRVTLDGPEPPSRLDATDQLIAVTAGREVRTWRADGSPAWRKTMPAKSSTRIVEGLDALFVGLETPEIVALEPGTGEIKWRRRLAAPPTSLTITGDELLVGDAKGAAFALRIGSGFDTVWRRARAFETIGDPAFNEDLAFFAIIDNTIKAFDRDGGTQRWSHPLASRPVAGPVVMGEDVFVMLANGELVQVPAATGRLTDAAPRREEPPVRLNVVAAAPHVSTVFAIVTGGSATSELVAWRATKKGRSP